MSALPHRVVGLIAGLLVAPALMAAAPLAPLVPPMIKSAPAMAPGPAMPASGRFVYLGSTLSERTGRTASYVRLPETPVSTTGSRAGVVQAWVLTVFGHPIAAPGGGGAQVSLAAVLTDFSCTAHTFTPRRGAAFTAQQLAANVQELNVPPQPIHPGSFPHFASVMLCTPQIAETAFKTAGVTGLSAVISDAPKRVEAMTAAAPAAPTAPALAPIPPPKVVKSPGA